MVHKKKPKISLPEVTVKEEVEVAEEAKHLVREQRARIIVRNLPFKKLSEESVKSVFASYGNVIDVNLLKKKDGIFVGCGFVEFDNRRAATLAVSKANGITMNGRPIIVDWAIPKTSYDSQTKNVKDDVKEELDSDDEDVKPEIDDSDVDEKPELDDSENDDDGSDMNDDDDIEDDDEDEMDYDDVKPKKVESNDAEEGKTVFFKNIPFAATNEHLKECVKPYGPIVYALICVDKLTEHSKGTGFVKFKDNESAEKCIQDNRKIMLMDQPLEVSRALTRTQLENEKKNKKLKEKDSRNLYLVREGVILAGSPVAKTVSAPDMAKRLQIEQWKTQILRNLNMFVSKLRLVIHNIPSDYDDQKLRVMAKKYSAPNAVLKEAVVMHDRKKFDASGNPVSKEVAFVSFSTHEDALSFLRKVNNNPNVFTAKRRPIVSFSIENRQILQLKQKRMEKSRAKVMGESAKSKNLLKMNRKQRRFLKRKEKYIEKRKQGKSVKSDKSNESKKSGSPSKTRPKNKSILAGASKTVPKKGTKRKTSDDKTESLSNKATKKVEDVDFSGVESVPGKKMKMRSRLKLKKQAEIHKERLKEVKKLKKMKKATTEKKQRLREREPGVKKHKKIEDDAKFTKLIDSYKKKIENASNFKKWYE